MAQKGSMEFELLSSADPNDLVAETNDKSMNNNNRQKCAVDNRNDGDGLELTKLTKDGSNARNTVLNNENAAPPPPAFKIQKGLYFQDGHRKIDYVLSFESANDPDGKKAARRGEFERNLRKRGLELEIEEAKISHNGFVNFVKIHAPWDVLAAQAEIMKLKMPIKKNDLREKHGKIADCLDKWCSNVNCFKLDDDYSEDDYFTAVFNRRMEDQFIITNKDTFFKDSERSRMVYDILIRTSFDASSADRIGINQLITRNVYNGAFPLHDGFCSETFIDENGEAKLRPTARQALYSSWAKPSTFFKFQPLDLIRRYFGEKIAIYFAWLGFYTKALFPAAIVGVLCIVYGALSLSFDVPSRDVCNSTGVGSIVMCPSCDFDCFQWRLNESCFYSRVTHVFDNWFTVAFAACMAIWATMFLEGWKRYQSTLIWEWDLADFELEEEMLRPEFEFAVKTKAKNPITQQWEPFMPVSQRLWRLVGSGVTVTFFLCLILIFVFGVTVYRVIVEYVLKKEQDPFIRSQASLLTSLTGACLNLICIMILDKIYQSLAWKLTDWECPRTQSDFEDSYTFKVFMFEFINFNSSLFYIAFFKGRFSTVPNDTSNYIFGYPQEACDPAGCMVELLIQLAVIMVGKQFLNNCMEILFPIMQNKWRQFWTRDSHSKNRWEQDYDLNAVTPLHLFDEYLEMVIQYGFVTLFVPAFPLAPLFALLNNLMEIRLDAYKLVVAYRRPMPARAQNLGIWYDILDGVSKLAVLCNACVIAFTSDFVPRLVYQVVYSLDSTLNGYVENKLAYYDPGLWCQLNANRSEICHSAYCRYMDYRNPPCSLIGRVPELSRTNQNWAASSAWSCDPVHNDYKYNIKWWHILAAKLAFVLIFEHLVFLIKGTVAYLIPDIPHNIMLQMQRENFLAKQAFYEHEMRKHQDEKRQQMSAAVAAAQMDLNLQNQKSQQVQQKSQQQKAMAEKVALARQMASAAAKKSASTLHLDVDADKGIV